MSVLLATRYADRVEMATDGGVWNYRGDLVGRRDKLRLAPTLPLAVSGVGDDESIDQICRWVQGATMGDTVDGAISYLERTLPMRPQISSPFHWTIVIAAISETHGPCLWKFRSLKESDISLPALKPHFGEYIAFCPELSTDELRSSGWSPSDFSAGLVARFDLMRTKIEDSLPDFLPGRKMPPGNYVGCHIDHAVVTATGAVLKRIHEWPDRMGQPIGRTL
ncbi:hypothetical protein [Pelagibacterium sp.]|uniref:hypothetical protein n=1 Tax=Pelagibacterium sp. TaxID=1967288 RepID=UPI003BAD0EB8